jgi:hypothetical protein
MESMGDHPGVSALVKCRDGEGKEFEGNRRFVEPHVSLSHPVVNYSDLVPGEPFLLEQPLAEPNRLVESCLGDESLQQHRWGLRRRTGGGKEE